jgi:TrmH family RNA methyltransferase
LGLVRIPEPFDLTLLTSEADRPTLLLVAVNVEEPGNVGALVRTALASGADGFIGVGCTDPFHPKAVRTSMGSVFRLPMARHPETTALIQACHGAGLQTVGAKTTTGVPLPRAAFSDRGTALFVGSEAFGLEPEVCSKLDLEVTIPMGSEVDSFAVNAAAAIALYEIRRQR